MIFLGTRLFVDEADMVRDLEFLVPDHLERPFTPLVEMTGCSNAAKVTGTPMSTR